MKVIVRVYDGKLSTGAREVLIEALEEDDLLLTGDLTGDDGITVLMFEEEVVDAEVGNDVPKEED